MLEEMGRQRVDGLERRIRERREALKLSQADVAERMGGKASEEQVAHYEHGRRSPAAAAIVGLARALECSADYLLGMSGIVDPGASQEQPQRLQNLGRPLTPLPEKAKPTSLEAFLRQAEEQGVTYATFDGQPYKRRKDGWEPV